MHDTLFSCFLTIVYARAGECQYSSCHSGLKRGASEPPPVEAKRMKSGVSSETPKHGKQFPLVEEESNESKTGVLVRVYDNPKDSLKINEVVHIYGILEHTRLGSSLYQDESIQDGKGSEPVPRVHAIVLRRMRHNNPLLPDFSVNLSAMDSEIRAVRENVVKLLTSCLHSDAVAAEYTLLHLISCRLLADSPYPTMLPALNLICQNTDVDVPPGPSSIAEPMEVQDEPFQSIELFQRLLDLLPNLVTQLATVEMTLNSLNNGPCLMPIRDSVKGVLNSGRLQIPDGTQVLVDETRMAAGQLQARGLLNLRAMTLLATQQRVPYDFQFYTQEWETNARVLIVSIGPSLIKPVLAVPYLPEGDHEVEPTPTLTKQQWSDIRKYITLLPVSDKHFVMDTTLQQQINNDFVRWRRDKATFIEADEFAVMLCLLRLLCLSYGDEQATPERWQVICNLEQERRSRMRAYKIQPAA
ncbi:putative vinculin [Fasciola gigantica]|uniref:Mini-chromosome maintenance complex-binding protein n=1 Tax=Fasciola gigantica TaxID=46835 RepID=A0A504YSX7_FASGI|nr:putative vinculin [Fasciola gigantica]